MTKTPFVIIVPSRIGSTRLPNKPLAKIGDKLLIEHLIDNLSADFLDQLYIATDAEEICQVVRNRKAKPIMTGKCNTGSDRVFQALKQIPDYEQIKYVINIQGDMPFVNPQIIHKIIARLQQNDCDIVTASSIIDFEAAQLESNVKLVKDKNNNAMYFSRSLIPHGAKKFDYHVGIYGFTSSALEKFVNLPQSEYEQYESLEQLRALENGMTIGICESDEIPISIDTPADLEKAREYYHRILS